MAFKNSVRKEETNYDTYQHTKRSNKKMVNDQLRDMSIYQGTNFFRYNMNLLYNKKGTERKLKYKISYHDIPCNRMVQNNTERGISIANLV